MRCAPVHALPKFIVVVDDVNVHDWKEVIWALTTRAFLDENPRASAAFTRRDKMHLI